MRLDKFLQLTGLIKRRTLAKALCELGRVHVNGKAAKPATEVRVGDLITAETGRARWQVQVKQLPKGSVPSHRRSEFITFLGLQRVDIWDEEE